VEKRLSELFADDRPDHENHFIPCGGVFNDAPPQGKTEVNFIVWSSVISSPWFLKNLLAIPSLQKPVQCHKNNVRPYAKPLNSGRQFPVGEHL